MEESVNILRVDTGEAVQSVNDLRENIKLLKANLGELTIGSQEYQDTLEELTINQNALKNAMHATSASLEDVVAAATSANVQFDEQNKLINQGNISYNELVHTMAALKEEWRSTGDAARRAELGERIEQVNAQLKGMDASVGNFQRNVGNYSSALEGLEKGFLATAGGAGSVINPVKNVTAGFKALSATPVIGILGLLANVLSKVIENLNSSEENANRMSIALAPLRAGTTALTKVFQFLGEKLADVAEWFNKVLDKFGLISDVMKGEQEIVKEDIELQKRRREIEMANADDQLKIAKLKAQAAEKDKYTAAERLKFIEDAAKTEKEISDRNIDNARKEYDILKRKAELAGNSKEDNDKLAEAYVKLQNEETNYFNKVKELNAQRVEAINQIKAETAANKELLESKQKVYEFDEEADEVRALADEEAWYAEQERQKADTDALMQKLAERQKAKEEAAQREIDLNKAVADANNAYLEEQEQKYKEKMQERIATMGEVANATSGLLSSLADMYESDEKNSEKNAKKIKNLRIASAIIDMLNGAVMAYSTAQTLGPPQGPIIGAINAATVIATGMANINKIKSTNPSGGGASSAPAVVSPPSVDTGMQSVRSITSASEEERLNRMASNQRVYILQSDIEASGNQSKVQVEESSF